ncbi:hypothetical protein THIAE_06020 [Thiomicrospira aerophila AL3]|uniref:DUF3577 domain-containing protein n=1 Tax=Thiomicrospira aerophila AL3 TaxID=717772 RepID=W0DUM0_9GAMM|nr:DUF3577 domain-containing protein [Thiomicrospira aerophila]AHF02280.1 hypothetical protein THIAE_06020 [Thiomicrospira aerophila AL3]
MTTVNQNAVQNSNDYFNLHTKGLCYVNRFRAVSTRKDTFYSVTLGFLRGHVDEVETTYIDCVIRNDDVLEILTQYQDAINGDSKVMAVAIVGDIFAQTYKKRDGSLAAGIKGRLIGLNQLKVDGDVVFKRENADQDNDIPVDQVRHQAPVQQPVAQAPRARTVAPVTQPAPVAQVRQQAPAQQPVVAPANFEGEFLDVVKLDKNDPNFMAKKDELKANGYRWNRELASWVLAA